MNIWQKLTSKVKSWFGGGKSGGNTKKKKKEPPQPRAVSNNRDARNQTVSSRTGAGSTFNKRELVNSLNAQKKEEDRVKAAFKAKSVEYKDITGSTKSEPPKPKLTEKQELIEQARTKRKENFDRLDEEISNKRKKHEANRKSYHEATGHKYDTERGTKEERARARQRIKAGEYQSDPKAAKWEYETHPVASMAARTAANSAALGIPDAVARRLEKYSSDEMREAEDIYRRNQEEHPWIRGGAEFAGALVPFGGTAKAFEGLGARAVGRAAETQIGRKLGAEALARTMGGTGAKAAIARSLVGDAIQDSTLGLIDTTARISQEDDLKTADDYLKAIAKGQAVNYAMGLAGNVAAHGLPVAGRAVRNAWGEFADESRKLRIVPKGVDELLEERKRIMDDIFSKNERSDPNAINRIKEIDAEIERIRSTSGEEITEETVKKSKRKGRKTTEKPVKNAENAVDPEAKITEDNVKKEQKRKPTKNEQKRAELQAERDELAETYRAAKEDGSMSEAELRQTLDDMQELDAMLKDLDVKIRKADAKRAAKQAKASTPEPETRATPPEPEARAEAPETRAEAEMGVVARNATEGADDGARAENAGAGERTEFRRSEEQTEREQARNRRTTNNRESASAETFARDFDAFTSKVNKATELRERIRSASSPEERASLKAQLDALSAEIDRDYRRASLRYHPDRGGSDEWMGKFNEARDSYRNNRSYSSRGFSNAESSTRTRGESRSYTRTRANERTRASAEAGGGNGNTPPPGRGTTPSGEKGFNRPRGKAKKSEPSYVYRGEDTVFKRKEAPTLKEEGERVLDDARMRFADSHAPFEDEARKYAKTDPEKMQDMLGATDAHRRSNATATRSIHNKQLNYKGDAYENGKSLFDIYKGLDKEEEKAFDYYMLLQHAPDRLREGKPIWDTRTLIDGRRLGDPEFVERLKNNRAAAEELEQRIRYTRNAEVKEALQKELDDLTEEMERDTEETIARMKEVWDAEAERVLKEHPNADFENRAQDVYRYTQNELNNLVEAGIHSKEEAIEWSARHPFYVPTHRDGYYAGLAGNVNGSSVGAKGIQAATGSDLDIRSIRDQLEEMTRQNWEDITLNDMLKSTFGDKIREKPAGMLEGDFEMALENNISISKSKDGKRFFAEIREGGERYRVEIDKKYVDGLKDWNKRGKTGIDMIDVPNEALSKAAKVFKDLITEKSPIFLLKNPMRDFPEAYANSRQPKEFRKNLWKAFNDLANGGPYSTALKDAGISQSSFFDLDKELLKEMKKGGKNPLKLLTDKIAAGNQFMEMWPRLTEYMATFEKAGIPIEQADKTLRNRAAANAADVTVNFGRSGSISKTINKGLVPFFNPSVQGWSKFVRNFSEQPNTKSLLLLMARFTAIGAGATAINNYFLADNPNYQQISARDKANNYLIPVTLGKDRTLNNTDTFIKIPKSRFAAVYSLPIVNAFNENKMGWAEMIKVANDQIAPVSPVENNIFAPLISTLGSPQGKTWYGSPIVPESMMDLPPSEQYDANTSWFGKMAGKATEKLPPKYQISPKKADYLIDAETGVIGDFALPMTTPSRQGDSSNPLKKYGTPFVNVPKRAFSIDSATQNDISSRYYDQAKLLEQKNNSKNASKEDKAAYKKYESWNSRVKDVTNAMRYVQGSDMPNKQEAYRELAKLRNDNMQKALDGKVSLNNTRDIDTIHKYAGTSYTIENLGKSADQKALKAYGAAVYGDLSEDELKKKIDSDTEFYKGYKGIAKTQNALQKIDPKLKGGNALTYAVGLADSGANDDVFASYGTTVKSRTESASKAQRAKDYLKNNGSVNEFAQLENAVKNLGKLSDVDKGQLEDEAYSKLQRGEMSIDDYNTELKKISYNANLSYVGKAVSLAQSGAPARAYNLYDIKDRNVQKGYNLAAMGIDSIKYHEMSQACDKDGNGYLKTAEIRDYVANSDVKDKATLFDALCYYPNVRNPFGAPKRYSAERAAEVGKQNGVKQINVNAGADNTVFNESKSNSSGYRGYYRRGYRRRGYRRRGGGGKSKAPAIKQSNFKAGKATYTDLASTLKKTPPSVASPVKMASTVKIAPPNVKFKKYEV